MPNPNDCPTCNGVGWLEPEPGRKSSCEDCNGTGFAAGQQRGKPKKRPPIPPGKGRAK